MMNIECPISGKPMGPVFTETVLGKYKVTYYYCKESGLLKTESPYWLNEAYQSAINNTDTGLVRRNIANSNILEVILELFGIEKGQFLDVAGGYGLLTRLMRDKGFDCYTTDKYCENVFAKTFEPNINFKADALFAFEVFEHIENPLEFLATAFHAYDCKTAIFSTLTFPGEIPPRNWWYYSFEGGQHITFYQPRTLALLAERLTCKYHMVSTGLHIITDRKIRFSTKILINTPILRKLLGVCIRHKRRRLSMTWADHLKMNEHRKKPH